MNRRKMIATAITTGLAMPLATIALADEADTQSEKSLETAMAFMGAMGKGDMQAMGSLMADDMIWYNEGDKDLPWIGTWKGKETIFGFLKTFSENIQVLKWDNEDVFASGDTVAVFGRMNLKTSVSERETGEFTFAVRAKVKEEQLVSWTFLEDTFAVSNAFHGK